VSVQICEGVWRNRSGQRLVITQCKPDDDGQQWTDGDQRYSDNGSFYGRYGGCSEQDLVENLGPLPDNSQGDQTAKIELLRTTLTQQTAEIDRLRSENERLQAEIERLERQLAEYHAGWLKALSASTERLGENERLQAEIERLRGELQQSEARNTADAEAAEYAARLEMQLDNSREALRDLQEDHTAMDHRAEGARSAYLAVIKALWEMRR